jgi:CRISPR/Cas system CMR subunit Cmr4 (Cas7 group RAMP superfamily)
MVSSLFSTCLRSQPSIKVRMCHNHKHVNLDISNCNTWRISKACFHRGSKVQVKPNSIVVLQGRCNILSPWVKCSKQGLIWFTCNVVLARFQNQMDPMMHSQQSNVPPVGSKMGHENSVHGRIRNIYYFNVNKEGPMNPQDPKLAVIPMARNPQVSFN